MTDPGEGPGGRVGRVEGGRGQSSRILCALLPQMPETQLWGQAFRPLASSWDPHPGDAS